VDQIQNLADSRLLIGCIYCGGGEGTREHVPSKVFLDAPYPENLSVIGACYPCNNSYSKDEEYLACLIEAAIAGDTDPRRVRRISVAKILEYSPALRNRIEAARTTAQSGASFSPEAARVERVLAKLAMGHAAYELAQECRHHVTSVWWQALHLLDQQQREEFDAPEVVTLFREIGSRGMQRLKVVEIELASPSGEDVRQQIILNDWIDVQPQRYRYLASDQGGIISIRMVIGEYLAAEVTWEI
jgi:BMFP domain-containing protein YqiC